MKKDQAFVKPTSYRSRAFIFAGALALALLWYVLSIWLLSGWLAQGVAVAGAVVLAAGVPLLRGAPRADQTPQAQVLAGLAHEVWVINRETETVAYRNHIAAARVTAYVLRDIIPADQYAVLRALVQDTAIPHRAVFHAGDRSFRPIVTPLPDGRHVTVMLHDISDDLAEQKVKDDFVSTVSHELRSPLTSIKGSMGLLLSNAAGDLPKAARGLLEISQRNADRLVLILNDILDLQKIADDGMEFEYAPLDASALVQEAIAASALFLQRFDLNVEVEGAETPVMLHSDANRLIQVLGNLLTNAAKFSPAHSTITVSIDHTAKHVTLSVRDEGEGIPAAEQNKIFERFADMTNSDRQKKGGSGLGLSICKAIVDKLGGTIGFDSTEGVGTSFYVTLPRDATLDRSVDVDLKRVS